MFSSNIIYKIKDVKLFFIKINIDIKKIKLYTYLNFQHKEGKLKILKKEMKLKGLSPEGLAKKLNVSKQTVHNWVVGDCVPMAESAGALKNLGFSDAACLEPSKEVEVE